MNYNPADTQMPDEASTQGIDSLAPQPDADVTLATNNFADSLNPSWVV